MNILVIGNGGREHAIINKLLESSKTSQLFCAPGIDALTDIITNVNINVTDINALKEFAVTNKIGLTVVGPEAPLVEGIVDLFEATNLPIFGPSQAASELEGSKSFSKDIMKKYDIPTASYGNFTDYKEAKSYIESQTQFPLVIKASGLAAGKGVVIPESKEEALAELKEMMLDQKFGNAADEVVIESFLVGEEASIFAICDGNDFVLLTPAQDHKRIGEGDTGKNTGGMGAYAPAPVANKTVVQRVADQVVRPLLDGMNKEGKPYKGTLFVGLMIDNEQPSVVEFNVRFGDPETQVVLSLIDSDFVDLLYASATGTIANYNLKLKEDISAMTVVMVSGGYPDAYEKGKVISGLDNLKNATVFHAGTKVVDGQTLSNGGRVLNVTAKGENLKACADTIYSEIDNISFEKSVYRKDIGHRSL